MVRRDLSGWRAPLRICSGGLAVDVRAKEPDQPELAEQMTERSSLGVLADTLSPTLSPEPPLTRLC